MIYLGDVGKGRDNNFNLLRILAAGAVLVSHAWPIAMGPGTDEPLDSVIGFSLGWLAVGIFFALSGYLISGSFDRSKRFSDWLAARVMRLFPALFVALCLTMLVIGPVVTDLSLGLYFSALDTHSYLPRNMSLFMLQYDLPGVFSNNPYPGAINGSLWTLSHEVTCYGGVALLGFMGIMKPGRLFILATVIYGFIYTALLYLTPDEMIPGRILALTKLTLPYYFGCLFYVYRDRLPLSWIGASILGVIAFATHGSPVFREVFILFVAYAVFVLSYLPGGIVRYYNRLGDYSYGLYIYAFPVQQSFVWQIGRAHV